MLIVLDGPKKLMIFRSLTNIELNDPEKAVKKTCFDFAERELKPIAAELDRCGR